VAAQTEAIANLVRLGPRFILLYVFFDVAEDLLAAGVVATASPRLLLGVAALSVGKWLALLGCVVPLLLVAVGTAVARQRRATAGRGTGSLADELVALRAQVLVVLVLAIVCFLPGDTGKQVDDGMLLLVDRPGKAAATIVVAVLLGVLLWASGRWCLRAYCEVPGQAAAGDEARQPDQGLSRESLIGLAAAGVVLLAAGLVGLFGDVSGLVALCVPGAAVLLFALLSVPVRGARPRQWGTREPPERLLWWLAAAPALLLGLVAVRGGALVAVTGDGRSWWFLGAGLVGLAVGLAVVLFDPGLAIQSRRSERAAGLGNVVGWLIAAAMLGVAGWAAAQPIRAGETIGAWTVILVFSAVLLAAVAVLVLLGDKLPARGPLAVVGLRRVPLVAAVVGCVVLTSVIDTSWAYHDVRVPQPRTGSVAALTVDLPTALAQWRSRVGRPDSAPRVQPMVFIATSGGGIRSAYWTAAVLPCLMSGSPGLDEQAAVPAQAPEIGPVRDPVARQQGCAAPAIPRPETVFLASGISGGSVGLAVTRALDDDPKAYTRALAADFLGASMAAYAFRDGPASILRTQWWDDRAAILERALAEAVSANDGSLDCGFLRAAQLTPGGFCQVPPAPGEPTLRFPLLMLNGAAVDDGCRITASALDLAAPHRSVLGDPQATRDANDCRAFGNLTTSLLRKGWTPPAQDRLPVLPATRDVLDYSCTHGDGAPQDLRLATAALISARFPWVSPTGALTSCADTSRRTYDLDGGVIESSAASPIGDMWASIAQTLEQWNQPTPDPRRAGRLVPPKVCFTPRLIFLDNGYATFTETDAAARPLEVTAPINASAAAQGTRSAAARQATALAFERAFGRVTCHEDRAPLAPRVAHFYPISHPGPQAPLGWSLSRFSRDDLRRELANGHNTCQIEIVHSWFVGATAQRCW
jgi:uncharacterized membrane protein